MPKAKPDQVVVHRIELQEKEREMLEAYIGGTVVKNTVMPTVVGAGVVSAAYIGYKTARAAYGWAEDIIDEIQQNKEKIETVATGVTYATPLGRTIRALRVTIFGTDSA